MLLLSLIQFKTVATAISRSNEQENTNTI